MFAYIIIPIARYTVIVFIGTSPNPLGGQPSTADHDTNERMNRFITQAQARVIRVARYAHNTRAAYTCGHVILREIMPVLICDELAVGLVDLSSSLSPRLAFAYRNIVCSAIFQFLGHKCARLYIFLCDVYARDRRVRRACARNTQR